MLQSLRTSLKATLASALFMIAILSTPLLAQGNSCWGQASAVFARTGQMGQHASEQGEPRLGLANLARALFELGVIPEPTLAALGSFVADELGLQIDRCTNNPVVVAQAENAAAVQAACWGQASALFAEMGLMGQHASEQPNSRLGLRNLARSLAELGVIPDDSLAALGAFVAADLGLEIDACD